MASEHIKFELSFKTNWWKDPPIVAIYLDDSEKFSGAILKDTVVEFSHNLNFSDHELIIHRSGKNNQQVRFDAHGNYQGQELIIDCIKIDGINIRNLIWTDSAYEPDYPEPWASQERAAGVELEKYVVGETNFGHNGVWRLKFTSPFYRFLMDWMG